MKYIFVKSLVVSLLIICGCTKNLDLAPQDTISDATFWRTADEFKLAANNLYLSLPVFNRDDLESDIAFEVPNAISNGTYQLTETASSWNTPYIYIRRCNNIIGKAAQLEKGADASIPQYVAEARFFRAFNYWQLFRMYGGVPIVDEVLDIASDALYSTRADRKTTVDFIINDLQEAANNLPEQKNLAASDNGRITKGAALALLARVALFEGTWGKSRGNTSATQYLDQAIENAKLVMESNQYSLFSAKGKDSYRYLFIEEGDDASENILARRYQRDIVSHGYPFSIDRTCYLPTKKLADMYLCSDGLPITKSTMFEGYGSMRAEYQNRDPRMTMTMVIPENKILRPFHPIEPVANYPFYPQKNGNTGYITYKYMSESAFGNNAGDNGQSHDYDHRLIRYAEVLLIYAEALFEKNGEISDADLDKSINLIRARVSMPSVTNAFIENNNLNMREEIRRERSIELALEGFRYDDLRRWKTAETELPNAIKGINIKISAWQVPTLPGGIRNPYSDETWQKNTDENGFIICENADARTFDPNRHYLRPLPTREILINPSLQQNPGW
ncbi:putative outer membrane starch-binding protein [Dyadobacter jejuensis]|uniref:Putative outer membrane starch-binding protein n=1 Tax=Dyadobacter jejuensis TaxID=1082580 RepID=A0A316ACR2_9BACT|nr:RagB/SusD family nutrient uptake outer membrane protein [Dyadobacter jejuensis]PWJ55545.1 putative outer membrane starch-binding protein [Dyadobacter jejuensis]